jgi:Fe-S-cluster containining protein
VGDDGDLDAGGFAAWRARMQRALRSDAGSDVPCGTCTACCRSRFFIHVEPDEADALRHIPRALLFPAPGRPKGHVVMGFGEDGACPMLVDDRCSIYDHRPRTCRTFDCRVFAAAGVSPDEDDKPLIAERVRRWRFAVTTDDDRRQADAVRAAAVFLRRRDDVVGAGTATQLAVLAVQASEAFLDTAEPEVDAVRAALSSR